jgi:hypothetical protein
MLGASLFAANAFLAFVLYALPSCTRVSQFKDRHRMRLYLLSANLSTTL